MRAVVARLFLWTLCEILSRMIQSLKRFLERYLGVPPILPGQDTAWNFQFDWPWPNWFPAWATFLPLLLLVLFVVGIYLRDAVSVSWKMRAGLMSIRLTTIGLLFLFLTNITLSVDGTELPVVIVMIDRSASMSLDDSYTTEELIAAEKKLMSVDATDHGKLSRLNLAKAILARDGGHFLKTIQERYRLYLYEFAETAAPLDGGKLLSNSQVDQFLRRLKKSPQPDGEQTSFVTSLNHLFDDFDDSRPAAIILLTDGIATNGENERLSQAAKLAEKESIPLYVIAIGSEQPSRDLELNELLAPDVAFVDDPVTFTADLTAFGLKEESVRIRLRQKDDPTTLAETTVQQLVNGKPQQVHLTYTPKLEGEYDYILEAVPLKNEANIKNNRQEIHVSVRKENLRVLLADFVPRREFRFVKHLLERHKTIQLHTVLQDADEGYTKEDATALRGFPKSRKELFRYDVILFGDLDLRLIPNDVLNNLYEYVRAGKSLLMIAGPHFNPATYTDGPLNKLLPILLKKENRFPKRKKNILEKFRLVVTPNGANSSFFRLLDDSKENKAAWNSLQKLYWFVEPRALKPGAVVFAEHPFRTFSPALDDQQPPLRNGIGSEEIDRGTIGEAEQPVPIILMHRVGAGKVLFHATDELWRWRRIVGDRYYGRYWVQAIRYLCRSKLVGKSRVAELETNRKEYTQGETVQFMLRFFEEKQLPKNGERVVVKIEQSGHATHQIELTPVRNQPLLFRGEFPQAAEGHYRAWVETPSFQSSPNSPSTAMSCAFFVTPPEQELRQRTVIPAELAALRRGIHGGHYTIATAHRVPFDIPPGIKTPLNQPHTVSIWNRWELMLLFASLLLAEWILRKRSRLV